MEEPPPPYSAAPQKEELRISPNSHYHPKNSQPSAEPNFQNNSYINLSRSHVNLSSSHINSGAATTTNIQSPHRFPSKIAIYNATGSTTDDFVITISSNDPQILFYISTLASASNKPILVLHSTPDSSSSPLATAKLDILAETVSINIYDNPNSIIKAQSAKIPNSSMIFIVQLPGSNVKEQFAWKTTQKRERNLFDGKLNGMKLVNCQTEQTIATWTKTKFSTKKLGKVSFLAKDRRILGERFELMAIVTLLSILERERKK